MLKSTKKWYLNSKNQLFYIDCPHRSAMNSSELSMSHSPQCASPERMIHYDHEHYSPLHYTGLLQDLPPLVSCSRSAVTQLHRPEIC